MGRRERIVAAATSHAFCGAHTRLDDYIDVVVRPVDRNPRTLPFYVSNPKINTAALFAVGALRLAGCLEPECLETYFPAGGMRSAMRDLQALARRFDAWVTSSPPVPPMEAGDVWIVANEHGRDVHAGVCVCDATMAGTSMHVRCVEGGQFDGTGSTAVASFARTWDFEGNRWKLGDRYLIGYASAARMPVPDSAPSTPSL